VHQGTSLPREVAGVRLPDSALAQKAVDLAFRVSPDAVRTHVVRPSCSAHLLAGDRACATTRNSSFSRRCCRSGPHA